jgi:flagellar hook-length control protein FliK
MPQTSALVVLPPQPVASTPSAPPAPAPTDSSFQDSLTTAQKRHSKSAPKATKTVRITVAPAKTPNKQAKSKAPAVASKPAVESDPSETPVPEEKPVVTEDAAADQPAAPDAGKTAESKQTTAPVVVAKDEDVAIDVAVTPKVLAAVAPAVVQATVPVKPVERKAAAVKPPAAKESQDSEAVAIAPVQKPVAPEAAPQAAQAAVVSSPKEDGKAVAVKPAGASPNAADSANDSDTDAAQPKAKAKAATPTASATDDASTASVLPEVISTDGASDEAPDNSTAVAAAGIPSTFEQQLQRVMPALAPKVEVPAQAQQAGEAQFADANHPSIVTGVHSQLLPNGGTMQLRLEPPDLGALQVTVQMRNGVMTAAFETSNEQATRMLSHSLNQLKTALETSGISVERMHVQQAPRQESKGDEGHSDSQQQKSQDPEQQQQSHQEQQRRQMLQRMWDNLSGNGDPLDLVA